MENIIDKIILEIRRIFDNKFRLAFVFVIACIFFLLSYYLYNKFVLPKLEEHKLNNEFNESGRGEFDNKDIYTVFLFKTEWCPHCKSALLEWDKFKDYVETRINKKRDDILIVFKEIDCDEDPDTAEKYNIKGYPTVKLQHNDTIYDFKAKPVEELLKKFIESYI